MPEPRVTILRRQEVLSTATLALDTEVVVGRSPQSQIVLAIGTVSRMHARFFHDERGVFLEDLGSANGTFVDGQKIEGVVLLRSGQLVRLGQSHSESPTILRIDLEPRAADVGKTRPISSLEECPKEAVATASHTTGGASHTSGGNSDETTDDDLTLPGLEPIAPIPTVSPLRTRPLRLPTETKRPPTALWVGVACLALFALMAAWHSCRDVDPWRNVSITPELLEAGRDLTIVGLPPGFEFGFDLELNGIELDDLEVSGATGRAQVPNFPELPPGDHQLLIVGIADAQVVFERSSMYRKAPRIDNITPQAAHLGERVVLQGGSLGDSENPPDVFLGKYSLEPESVDGSAVVFRVPMVAESTPTDLPVRVSVGGLDAIGPSTLEVLSNRFESLPISLSAKRQAEDDLWEIHSILGPILYVRASSSTTSTEDGSQAAEAALPPEVAAIIEGLTNLTDLARQAETTVTATAERGRYLFTASTSESPASVDLFALSNRDLDELSRDRPTEASPAVRAEWFARTLTDVVGTLAGGRTPPVEPSDAGHRAALHNLVASNVDRGGPGKPGLPDLERLSLSDRKALERSFVSIPPSLEPITGRWIGQLENVFDPGGADQVEVILDLVQIRNRVSGTARLAFRSQAGTQGFPEAQISGTIAETVPPSLSISVVVNRPLGRLRLEGTVGGDGIRGTFESNLAPGGSWQVRKH